VLTNVESQGPSEEADADFAKELAKMLSDTSSDARKVDKKTALAMWDSAVLPGSSGGPGRKRRDTNEDMTSSDGAPGVMKFTVISRRGNKQQVCSTRIAVLASALTPLYRPVSSRFR